MSTAPDRTHALHRHPERGDYDRATIDAILDEALICHLAWVDGDSEPRVIPTIHVAGRRHALRARVAGQPHAPRPAPPGAQVCVETTIVDGLVLARSTPKHSMNYRSWSCSTARRAR